MTLSNTAQDAADEISRLLSSHDLSDEEKGEVMRIVGDSLVRAVEQTAETHRKATLACCGPEADLAHKIADQVERNTRALIANLMAMR